MATAQCDWIQKLQITCQTLMMLSSSIKGHAHKRSDSSTATNCHLTECLACLAGTMFLLGSKQNIIGDDL